MARIRLTNNAEAELAAPAGQMSVYSKLDNFLYIQADDGIERQLTDSSSHSSLSYSVEYFTLTVGDILSAGILLAETPLFPERVLLQIDGAATSFYALDFTVAGNSLTWSGLRLDGLLEPGDVLQVIYYV